jgi:hypothetical protein
MQHISELTSFSCGLSYSSSLDESSSFRRTGFICLGSEFWISLSRSSLDVRLPEELGMLFGCAVGSVPCALDSFLRLLTGSSPNLV